MAVLSELRYPTTRPAKVVSALLAIILFGFVSIATVAIVDAYQLQGSERFTLVSEERGKLVGLTHSRINPA